MSVERDATMVIQPFSNRSARRAFFISALLAGVFFNVAGFAQAPPPPAGIEEEDLGTTELKRPEIKAPKPDPEELARTFEQAVELFQSADQPASTPSFLRIVEILGPRFATGELQLDERDLLARALSYLAQVNFNLGDVQNAETNLTQLIQVDPSFEIDRATVSPKLTERFDRLKRQMVAQLELTLDPPDARVLLDGVPLDALHGPVAVLAGERTLEAVRPGYAPRVEPLKLAAGKTTPRDVVLERTAAVLRLLTRPSEAQVIIDGAVVAATSGSAPADFLPTGLATVYPHDEFSQELVIDPIEQGLRVIEIRKPGYRSYRAELAIEELIDYRLPPIVLDEERGFVVLKGLPPKAVVRVDGEPVTPENLGSPTPQLALAPGEHRLTISDGAAKMFATQLRLADRQSVEITVRLKPGLALLGVLGGDPTGVSRLQNLLRATLGGLDGWTLLDRSETLPPSILAELGIDAARLRRLAAPTDDTPPPDWSKLQALLDLRAPGLVYVLGALSDDLVATHADLWILPAAPGPARPDRLRIALDDPAEANRLKTAFSRVPSLRRAWVGALVIDSEAAQRPVVAHVTPGGPAEAAGLMVGDQIAAVAQVPVLHAADFAARIAAAETGETLQLAVQSASGARNVDLRLGSSPLVLSGEEPDLLESVVFADLVLLAEKAGPDQAWVIELNQAMVLVRTGQWDAAVRRLRALKVPEGEQLLGRAAVDYWLGLALTTAGPSYRGPAIAAFERAAAAGEERLYHRDGPWVAPRARARLVALGAAAP